MEITKQTDTSIKVIKEVESLYEYDYILERKKLYEDAIAEERIESQGKIDKWEAEITELNIILSECEKLGVKTDIINDIKK